jgi:hypothetical protein
VSAPKHGKFSLQSQLGLLKLLNPGGSGYIRKGRLDWFWVARPTPISREYKLRLQLARSGYPTVVVEYPNLDELAMGRAIPHVYNQKAGRLCLYLPGTGEWRPDKALSNTIIPWASLWLFFFEEWMFSGEWRGGGIHPQTEAEKKEE